MTYGLGSHKEQTEGVAREHRPMGRQTRENILVGLRVWVKGVGRPRGQPGQQNGDASA